MGCSDVFCPAETQGRYVPPKWVLAVAALEAGMPFASGYVALFAKYGVVTCGSWQSLCIPTLGEAEEVCDSMIRGWGARQAVLWVPFACAYLWQDRNVWKVAFLAFWFRAIHDLLAIAMDGFRSDALLSFALVLCNQALVAFTMTKIWRPS